MIQTSLKIAKSLIWVCFGVILFSPLYISGNLFFPFIVTKTVAFAIAVDVMFVTFLFLCWKSSEYRVKFTWPVILMGVYIILSFISAIFGDNFSRSFWSNNERSEGILLLLHLFLFLVVLSGFLRKLKDWLLFFDITVAAGLAVALVALGQYFKLDWVLSSSGGQRLAGTIGNAGYVSGYLFFSIFSAIILYFKRPQLWTKIFYAITIVLNVFIVLNTYTRGGIIALIISLFLFGVYMGIFYFSQNKILRNTVIVLLVVAACLGSVAYINRKSAWVQSNQILYRITDLSTESNTAQNRLWTWQSAFSGVKERPILGWGYENFYQPFDKYYNPQISRKAGSVVWFDRAHNVVFDRLISGGIVGLISYLLLLFVPLFFMWRGYKEKEGDHKKYIIPVLCTLTIVGFFIQDLFIFEALVIYIPLFTFLAFIGVFGPEWGMAFLEKESLRRISFIVAIVAVIPWMYIFTLRPLYANIEITKALGGANLTLEQRIELFKAALGKNTNGNQEYRRQLLDFADMAAKSNKVDKTNLISLLEFTDDQLQREVADNPYSVVNYLSLMRFNELMYSLTADPVYLEKNIAFIPKILELSPNRQHVCYEIGYTYFYLATYYKDAGKPALAKENFDKAVVQFEKAVSLNEVNFDAHQQLATVLIYAGKNDEFKKLLSDIPGLQKKVYAGFNLDDFMARMLSQSVQAKNSEDLDFISQTYISLKPQDPQSYVQSALAYAYMGENDKAISLSQKVLTFAPEYASETNSFIEKVKKGEYKK